MRERGKGKATKNLGKKTKQVEREKAITHITRRSEDDEMSNGTRADCVVQNLAGRTP